MTDLRLFAISLLIAATLSTALYYETCIARTPLDNLDACPSGACGAGGWLSGPG